MKNQDDITLKAIDNYLKINKNDKGKTLSQDEIELLTHARELIVKKLAMPIFSIEWPNGSIKSTKISIDGEYIRIIPESEEEIFGTREEARTREKQLKSSRGRDFIKTKIMGV